MLHLRLTGGIVLADYFGPGSEEDLPSLPGADVFDALTSTRADTPVQMAPDGRLVSWSCYEWAQADPTTFAITLQGKEVPLRAELRFTVDEESGVLRRRTLLQHTGDGASIDISQAGGMTALLPADIREVVHLAGRWGAEAQVQRMMLPQTALLLESRSGKSGFEFSPYVALLSSQHTYFAQLCWSGNWQYYIRRQPSGRVVLAGGLNSWGFMHKLGAGDTLALPDMLLGCVAGGLDEATQRLHRYRRKGRGERLIPVQFNSWFPYQGEPTVEAMKRYAEAARDLGCEIFVLDAGWYTTEQENPGEGWWLRTGDWVVDRKLFPGGLEELSAHCREVGIDFGVWVEPEAIGPSAAIRRTHPEWLHAIGGRTTPAGERAILNLGVPQARMWIRDHILSLVQSTQARWLKWDFNTDLHQGGWADGLPEELTRQDPLVAHYQGLYLLQEELTEGHPDMILEMCSSGGGRFDAGILSHAQTYWISDQTHPLMKLAIHFGSQLAHPPEQCNDWLVEWPPHEGQHDPLRSPGGDVGDLPFRIRVAMLGSFGISAPVERWSSEDIAVVKKHVAWYKEVVRPTMQSGRQYLLTEASPLDGNGDWAAIWYARPEGTGGMLFAFRLANGEPEQSFALPRLEANGDYRLRSPDGWSSVAKGEILAAGLAVQAESPFRSVLLSIEKVGQE
jgi:alpha-galactosidase